MSDVRNTVTDLKQFKMLYVSIALVCLIPAIIYVCMYYLDTKDNRIRGYIGTYLDLTPTSRHLPAKQNTAN